MNAPPPAFYSLSLHDALPISLVIVKVAWVVPPVVLNALFAPVELEDDVITTWLPWGALLPYGAVSVAVKSAELTPAVAEVAPVRTMWSAAAALTVKA